MSETVITPARIEWALSSEDHRDPAAPYDYSGMVRAVLVLLAEARVEVLRDIADTSQHEGFDSQGLRACIDRIEGQQ